MGSDVRPGLSDLGTPLYRVAPWVMLRTPLLPAGDRELARRPREALGNPDVVRALAIASPTLLSEAERDDLEARESARVDRGLARYLIRMSTRPTPYGGFASVALARWDNCTSLALDERLTTRTRPDMAWLRGLLNDLGRQPAVRAARSWRADPLRHESNDRIVASSGGSVRATEPARTALAEARAWTARQALAEKVGASTGGSPEQVEVLLDQLHTAGLLVSDLVPAVTGMAATSGRDAVELVSGADPGSAPAMTALWSELSAVDSGPAGTARESFAAIAERAGALHAQDATFQTDLARGLASDGLSADVAMECARAAELLLRLSPAVVGNHDLVAYARRFEYRYGVAREVPLTEVFDPVRGLGPLPHTHGGAAAPDPERQGRRANQLLALALEALQEGRRVVDLDPSTIDALSLWPAGSSTAKALGSGANPVAPLSLDLSAFVTAPDPAAIDRGDFSVVVGPNLGAPTAGRWLGRFADMLSASADEYYRWLNDAEQDSVPGEVPAEVVYLPEQARSTNVVLRPTLSEYEIVVSGRGSAEHLITVDDLLVGHDGTQLYLRSAALGVRVRPTARHMLNHHGAPPVCQFLEAVGRGHTVEFSSFEWGQAEMLPVLPRVTAGRVVLSPARWLVTVPGGKPSSAPSRETVENLLRTARERWGLPDRAYATVADNRLLLDLTEPDDVDQLRRELTNGGGTLRLDEALPDVVDAWLPGPGGRYLSEIVVSLVRRPPSRPERAPETPEPAALPLAERVPTATLRDRVRLPGSDWLFAKFYAPFEQLDQLLTSDLADLFDMAMNSGLARRWFFLRYSDPEPHLRVRWQGDPDLLLRHLLGQVSSFGEHLVTAGRISRLVIDTYEREVERYGGPVGVELCEDVFQCDSEHVRRLLSVRGGDGTELAVSSTAAFLEGAGLGASERVALYERLVRGDENPANGRAAGEDYRARKGRLRELLTGGAAQPLAGALDDFSRAIASPAEALRRADTDGQLAGGLADLWPSLLHMHHNRLVGPGREPEEIRLYHLLLRTERGLLLSQPRTL